MGKLPTPVSKPHNDQRQPANDERTSPDVECGLQTTEDGLQMISDVLQSIKGGLQSIEGSLQSIDGGHFASEVTWPYRRHTSTPFAAVMGFMPSAWYCLRGRS